VQQSADEQELVPTGSRRLFNSHFGQQSVQSFTILGGSSH
jgi:hypothetical protein